MNQKKETVPLHGYVGVTADVEWEKEGESGRLTFHGTGKFSDKFPPLEFKVDHLKGSSISLTRFIYFLNGKEKARFIEDLEEGRVVNANMVAFYADWCLEGKSQFPSTYEQMLYYKAITYTHNGYYAQFACRLAGASDLVRKIAEWAAHVLQARGPRCEITGIYDYDTKEILEILGSDITFTKTMEEKGFPVHFPSLLNTPGRFMPHVSVGSNAFARRTRSENQRHRMATGNFRRTSQSVQRPRAQNMARPAKRVETLSRWDDLHDRAPYGIRSGSC